MATPFDSVWDTYSSIMDAKAEEKLGDRVEYSKAGGPFVVLPAFVIDETEGETGVDEIDEVLSVRKRLKIRPALIGGQKERGDRIRHPKLGTGEFQPAAGLPATQGRYIIFDVQEV